MLYTIGFQNKTFRSFLKLLKMNNINCVIDVRTFPYSNSFSEFNEPNLKQKLKEKDIYYMVFSKEFGKRRESKDVYQNITYYDERNLSYLNYKEVWKDKDFLSGIKRIIDGINKDYNICFLSKEKNPFDTYRTFMISEYLYKLGYKVIHIKDEDIIIDHETLYPRIEDNFYHEKKNFIKFKEEQQENVNLFTMNKENDELINDWDEFFKNYTFDKGFQLKNIMIALKDLDS